MSYKWTRAVARDENLTDAKRFNKDYDNYKSLINGGLDRDNLPESALDETHFSDGAFVKYTHQDGIFASDDVVGNVAVDYGVLYDQYSGGWYTEDTGISDSFFEGMLQIEFNCWYHVIDAGSFGANLLQWCEFQIIVDSNPVAYTGRLYNFFGQAHIIATIPISSGTHDIKIQWRCSSPEQGVSNALPLFYFDGGALTAINRAR